VTGRDAARGRAVVGAIQAAGDEASFLRHELDGSVEGGAGDEGLRIDRHPRQQCGHLPAGWHTGNRRGDLRPHHGGERKGAVLPHSRTRPRNG
jgi:hypothetical protein